VSVGASTLERMFDRVPCGHLPFEWLGGSSDGSKYAREVARSQALLPTGLRQPNWASEAIVRDRLRALMVVSAETPNEAIYEFWIPESGERADVVFVGAHLSAFEIKAEGDSLKRLPRQAGAYGRLFDYCTIVVAGRHVAPAMEMLPEWWGVIGILSHQGVPSFEPLRSGTPNHGVDPETLVRLLWREEVRAVLSALGHEPDTRASRASMWRHLLSLIELDRLKEVVRRTLLGRDPNLARIPTRRFSGEVSG
jgi:hypothetical protein